MSDDPDLFHVPHDQRPPIDPIAMARRDLKKALPKRFYKVVTTAPVEGGFGLLLDGKPVRTPGKASLVLPTEALADSVALEWSAQTDLIEPDSMPLTKLANTAIDGVARNLEGTIAEVAKFAETDLVCYRAGTPDALVAAQAAYWDPILDFARDTLGARFILSEGIVYVEQPASARLVVRRAVEAIAFGEAGAMRLAALSVMTSLTGSVLAALAVAMGAMTVDVAWDAAHVDEDFQARMWGADAEATARRERRWTDMKAAADLYRWSV